jgi:hypothetical protein
MCIFNDVNIFKVTRNSNKPTLFLLDRIDHTPITLSIAAGILEVWEKIISIRDTFSRLAVLIDRQYKL